MDLITAHEMLYLEHDLKAFMERIGRVLSADGSAYLVLGSHAENPLWPLWKPAIVAAGHAVYDHLPLDIMAAASACQLLPSVQPLRTFGWETYDANDATFRYPDVQTMMDHHYRHKLLFRLRVADERSLP
jgi:hypothetical protein